MGEQRPAPAPAGRNLDAGRDLPAPYEDPWRLLGRDLRAVLASLRLRLWELSRRNRQGDLPVPAFWPRRLGSWFWPLALALVVAVVAAALMMLALNALPEPPGQETQALGSPALDSSGEEQPTPSPAPAGTPGAEAGDGTAQAPDPPEAASPAPPTGGAPTGSPATGPGAPTAVPPRPDPLVALLQPADPRQLVRAVRERPAIAGLQLELAVGFQALAPAERQRQAEAWRQKAVELGYERLELLDGSGRLLGRSARVGSGMILLDAAGAADVA